MIDVSTKFNTLRYARSEGKIYAKPETISIVKEGRVPKGDVFDVARCSGILAAKKTADWMVLCHPIPLDWIEVSTSAEKNFLKVQAEVKSIWKTGVEMEAITAVSAALLNIYDMLKPLDDSLKITDIQVVEKKGGKSDYTDSFLGPLKAGVLVISDSTFAGTRKDKSGKIISEILKNHSIKVEVYDILPDIQDRISKRLIELVDQNKLDLIFTTGGTGFGPKDITPEATRTVIERDAPGIAEAIRRHGKDRTPYAMLSREVCGVRNKSIIINLPGSSAGAKESMEALFPGLLHIFPMMRGKGH